MKRIDLIFNTIKALDKGDGVTTSEISNNLNLERSNVSKDLNVLVNNGALYKNNSRPVRYFLNNPNSIDFSHKSSLDNLAYLYPSLTEAIKLAKTAILYPPNGMNSLIIGNTGVGKSMLAELMHEYANSINKDKDMPFLHFNCSDYSNNVQLLSSHLFGVKKGTFTGATEDRAGLIEQADGGILFLDEIHNLPSEGQEMLFIFMDTGYFKRFGEVSKKIKSSARIICATNKDINTSLLDTFIRRIPIKIYLPDLNERLIEERLTLIEYFLREESIKLSKPILVSYNAMLCLLSYDCPYNIGQLKNDITLAVANAYASYFINDKKQIKINSPDLPNDLKKPLNTPLVKERTLINSLKNVDGYFTYDENTEITSLSFLKQKHAILSTFKKLIKDIDNGLKSKNIDSLLINSMFVDYFNIIKENMATYQYSLNKTAFDEILNGINNLQNPLKDSLNDDIIKNFFHIHLDMLYDRINLMNFNALPLLNKIKYIFPNHYAETITLESIIEKTYNINLSSSEILFLILFVIFLTEKRESS